MAQSGFIDDTDELRSLAPVTSAPIRRHIFVCTGKSCSAVDSAEVREVFERELKARNMLFGNEKKGKNPHGSVLLTECASVGFCAIGAAVLVYPDGIWYAQVRATDVPDIIEQHILNDRPVERLALMKVPASEATEKIEVANTLDWEA